MLLTMTYSWPGPMPPRRRPGIRTLVLIRCASCGGPLQHTKGKGLPRQEDHEQGCEAFIRAMRIMRYVDEVNRSASEPAGTWRRTRRRRKFLRESAKKLSVAACESNPVAALGTLGAFYQAECQSGRKRAKTRDETEMAETLMRACQQLARGEDPAPITRRLG
jgi:hypothetical protein